MWKFALVAFLPAVFGGWRLAEPGPHRGGAALGGGLFFLVIGLIAFWIAKKSESRRPSLWSAVFMTAVFGLAALGRSQ